MTTLVIRHGLSEANNRNNIGTLAFAAKDAPLMEEGIKQARERAKKVSGDYGLHPQVVPVAVSTLERTRQTAQVMGFTQVVPYEVLDEVEHGMDGHILRKRLDAGQLPPAALRAAETILRTAPPQKVWITHGLVIAGLCHVLGLSDKFERVIPRFCEVRTLSI